jgi:hypothetical protein
MEKRTKIQSKLKHFERTAKPTFFLKLPLNGKAEH